MKRIFLALKISENLKKLIENFRNKYCDLDIHWMIEEDLHITIVPPWYSHSVDGVKKVLEGFNGKFGGIEISFFKIEFGPSLKMPRLIWLEGWQNEKLNILKNELEKNLEQKIEKRDFRPHVTIARFRAENFKDLGVREFQENFRIVAKLNKLLLIESLLEKTGARYKILDEVLI